VVGADRPPEVDPVDVADVAAAEAHVGALAQAGDIGVGDVKRPLGGKEHPLATEDEQEDEADRERHRDQRADPQP